MKRLVSRTALVLAALLMTATTALAQERGDALQLFSYGVSPDTRPNVSDAQIATSLNPDDWQAAFVRVMQMGVGGNPANDPRPLTMLIGNDGDSLYIGVAVQLPNSSIDNQLTLFFDQGTLGMLEGAAGAPGEYYVSARANGSFLEDGHWDGAAWTANAVLAARGIGLRKGTSAAERLYNFEFAIPLSKTGDAANSYLDIVPGDEIGVFPRITLNTGAQYMWLDTNANPTDPSVPAPGGIGGWGQIETLGDAIADRNVVSLAALNIVPTIDGNIEGDENWRFAFQKDIILTDLAGSKYPATLRLKETGAPENLVVGLSIEGLTPSPADYLAIYFDEGPTGGDRDFVLGAGDNAARVTGAGAFQDWNFDSNNWVADLSSQGSGAASVSGSGAWEVEMSVPFSTGQADDLNVAPEDELGALIEYFDSATGRSFWWSATINDKRRVIDPVDPVYNALGWGFLQTGGPFIQPIYPERGDILSGEYPLAVYALDPSDPDPGYGIESIRYEIRYPDPQAGAVTILGSGDLTRVVDPAIPIWTATLNTAEFNVSPTDELILVYVVDDGEVDPVSVPLEVFIDNSGSTANLGDPAVSVDSPVGDATVSGSIPVAYSAESNPFLVLDLVELYIDGVIAESVVPDSSAFYGTFNWNTTLVRSGEHLLQVRAVNSLGFETTSPAVLVMVDNDPPAIEVVGVDYPDGQAAAAMGQSVVISALVTDQYSGLDAGWVTVTAPDVDVSTASGTLMVDDGTNGDAVADDGVFTATLTVTQAASGSFGFVIGAVDTASNTGEVSGSVEIDNSAPAFQDLVVLDADNLYANGETVSLLATFDEAGYAVSAAFGAIDDSFVAGTEDVEDFGDGTYRIRYTIAHTNGRADGTYAIEVTATDAVGNTASGSVDLELDNSGPRVTAIDLDDEDLILNTDAVIFATVTDDDNVIQAAEFTVDTIALPGEGNPMDPVDGAFDAMTEEVTAALSIAALSEGQHTLFVRAQDVTGQWGVPATLDFVVDRVPPAIQNVSVIYPDGQTAARDGQTVLFTALVTDATAGLDTVTLTAVDANAGAVDLVMVDDGSNGDAVAGDDVFTGAVEVNSGKTGVFPFTIYAVDIVPNASSREGSVKLDNEAPTLSVDVQPAPRNGAGLSGEVYQNEVLVDGSYADVPDADFVKEVRIQVRNSAGNDVNDSPFVLAPTEDQEFSRVIRLVEGANEVTVSVIDLAGNRTEVEFTLTLIPAKETDVVGGSGGTVTSPDGTSVVVPAGALLGDYEITIERFPVTELPKPLDDNVTLIGSGHRFGPEGLVFHKQITVRLTYADADLDVDQDGVADVDENALAVFYWDGTTWIKTEAAGRSTAENFVDLWTNHFSVYALGVDTDTDQFTMYWTRNPFQASEGTTAVMELPGSGKITIRIYDLEGDLVRTLASNDPVSGSTNRRWDGLNDVDRYVGSGIYIYVFEFEDDSGSKRVIRKPIGVVQ